MQKLMTITVLLIGLVGVGCARSPVSPPPSPPGTSPAFDSLLSDANSKWSFVFADDSRISLVDMFGSDDTLLLDLRKATANAKSEFLGCESISPRGRFILAAYYHTRTAVENQPDAHLILLDLADLSMREVPVNHQDFQLAWYHDTHWLDDNSFLVPLNQFTTRSDGHSDESIRYLRKQVDDLRADTVLKLHTDAPVRVWHAPSSALLFASEHEPTISWIVHAVDLRGIRRATPNEAAYFNRKQGDSAYDPLCPVSVDTKRVVGDDVIEGSGQYWEENWDRHWVLLDGKKVRCSDGRVERDPVWDQDLKLLTWYEIGSPYQVFFMDAEGRYRKWHTGHYWGKVPKRKTASD